MRQSSFRVCEARGQGTQEGNEEILPGVPQAYGA